MTYKKNLFSTVMAGSLLLGQNVYGMHHRMETAFLPKQTIDQFLKIDTIDNTSNDSKSIILELYKNFVVGFHEMLSEKEYIHLDEAYTTENRELITNQNFQTLNDKSIEEIKEIFEKIQFILKEVHSINITTNRDAKTYFLKQAFNKIMCMFDSSLF